MFQTRDYQTGRIKLSGRSRAVVLDNRDPLERGRVIVENPIIGETVWINYLRTPGSFNVPSIGDIVYLECDNGYETHPVAWGNIVTGEDAVPEMPEQFKRKIPTNRGFFTPGGHLIEFDDGIGTLSREPNDTNFTTEKRGIRFTTTAGNKFHINEDTDANIQQILLEDISGNKLEFIYKSGEEKLTLNSTLDTVFNTGNDKIETIRNDSTLTINNDSTLNISNEFKGSTGTDWTTTVGGTSKFLSTVEHIVDAPIVRLGQNAQSFHAVVAENLVAYNDEHFHPAPQAPVGVLNTLPPAKRMSDIAGTVLDIKALKIFLSGNV